MNGGRYLLVFVGEPLLSDAGFEYGVDKSILFSLQEWPGDPENLLTITNRQKLRGQA